MSAYHQMGHHSRNLALNAELRALYSGAIMSPINETPESLAALCKALAPQEMIFDPAFFSPKSKKMKAKRWKYSSHLDSANQVRPFDPAPWKTAVETVIADCGPLGHRGICSPAAAAKNYSDDELSFSVDVGDALANALAASATKAEGLQTAILHTSLLEKKGRAETVASILTKGKLRRYYIVPRWTGKTNEEIKDENELIGLGKVIGFLAQERNVLVGFCGPEMILWKAVGAQGVATGKFSNQQRFDLDRYYDRAGGGGGSGYVAY